MKNKVLAYLETLLEQKYGDLNDTSGCYCHNDETGENEWMSVKEFVRLIEMADEEYEED